MKQEPYDGRRFGRSRWDNGSFGRHRHAFGYICVVLGGRFTEAGDMGRFRARPGDVLVHRPHEAHLDALDSGDADLLNLPLPQGLPVAGRLRIPDGDRIARLAETDPYAAARAVAENHLIATGETDWPDLLAATLSAHGPESIGNWARRHGLSPETVSRGFRKAYGTTPHRYRAEARARSAWLAVAASNRPLVDIALDMGFSDQSHMTRSLKAVTGRPPGRWRTVDQLGSRAAAGNDLA